MREPISRPGNARFRGPTSSHEFNKMEDDKYLDLIELYKQSNTNEQKLREAYQTIIAEHVALQNYVHQLENKLKDLEEKFNILDTTNDYYNGVFFKTGLVDQMTTTYPSSDQDNKVTERRADIDIHHRFATLPKNSQTPKTHVFDRNNHVVIPESLKVNVTRPTSAGEVTENNVLHAFDGNKNTYWRREVAYDPMHTPEKEVAIIEIELPMNLVNNLNINTLHIHPHPEHGVEISNIEMHYNNTWQQIEGFQQVEISGDPKFSPKRKWCFANRPVQKLRITLTQHHYLQEGEKNVFVLGAQEIGVELCSYESNKAYVLTPIDMSDVGMYTISHVEHILLNQRALSVSSELQDIEETILDYTIMAEENGILVPLEENQWVNQTSKKLWVKTDLYPDPNNNVPPCLHAIRLHYTKV